MVKFRVAKAITSGIPPTFVVIRGVPDEIASATNIPKGSILDVTKVILALVSQVINEGFEFLLP